MAMDISGIHDWVFLTIVKLIQGIVFLVVKGFATFRAIQIHKFYCLWWSLFVLSIMDNDDILLIRTNCGFKFNFEI